MRPVSFPMHPMIGLLVLLALVNAPASGQLPLASARDSATHLLNRVTWGPGPGQVSAVAREGVLTWLDRQLAVPEVDDPRLAPGLPGRFPVLAATEAELLRLFVQAQQQQAAAARNPPQPAMNPPQPAANRRSDLRALGAQAQQLVLVRAAESDHQVAEVLADFWFNHFNVFYGKGLVRPYLPSYVEQAIRQHALGRFEDLLIATARHPAMLFYLDNAQSVAEGATPPNLERLQRVQRQAARRPAAAARADSLRRALEQRLPTGINENYARELLELHTLGVDGGYTQADVGAVARILTGWSIQRPGQGSGALFNDWAHDRGAKIVLGTSFPSGQGEAEGIRLLKLLANHPATLHHVSAKLCTRLVADSPPDGCIDDAVAAWRRTGGDIRAIVRAIVHSPDFWAPQQVAAKVKTPLEFLVSAVRALGGHPDETPRLTAAATRLGQPIYLQVAPTGYPEAQEDWVNSGALLARMNLAMALATGRLPGVTVDLDRIVAVTANREALLDAIDRELFGGRLSARTRAVIAAEVADIRDPQLLRATAIGLALGGPDFQRQ